MTIANVYKAELIKTKNTFALWLTILGAALIPIFLLIAYIAKWKSFIPKGDENAWSNLFSVGYNGVSSLFIPLFIVLLTSLLINIEHKSNTWKHIFVQPVSKGKVYFSKLFVVLQSVILCYVLFVCFLLLAGFIAGSLKQELGFFSVHPPWMKILEVTFKSFLSTLALIGIHFWLSFRVKNIILPIGLGLAGVVISLILLGRWEHVIYIPYAYTALSIHMADPNSFLSDFHIISIIYFFVFTMLGYIDFKKYYRGN